jgi:hypothetical protein
MLAPLRRLLLRSNRNTAAAAAPAAPATPDVPKSRSLRSGKILRLRSDGSADVSIEASIEPNEWNLRFDVQRNVALLKRNCSELLSEGCESSEDEVETSLDSCLYVHACGIQLANTTDSSLLHVGSSFTICSISTRKSVQSRLSGPDAVGASLRPIPSSSENVDSDEPALSVLELQSDGGLNLFQAKNELQVQVHPP